MQDWIQETLSAAEFGAAVLPAVFLLGLLGAASNCCTPAVLGAVAGYSAAPEGGGRRSALLIGVFFLIGTVAALTILGGVAGFVSQIVGRTLGTYWRAFAGLVAVLFGLWTLNLLPVGLPKLDFSGRRLPGGVLGASLFGFAVGGGSVTCMVGCNPLLGVPLGVAALQGKPLWGAGMLTAFGIGYSLPLAGVLVGLQIGVGRLKAVSQRIAAMIKAAAGVVLVGAGFYLLATV